ncbi:MAG: hypothetical protein MJZ91_08945 [Bacteroidales bacterium]|nr:hypothetical protein [Bacteroidales bacterium]
MKKTAIKLTLSAAAAATAALLLAGCREENHRQPSAPKVAEIQIPAPIDTVAMDEEHRFRIRLIKSTRSNTHTEK